MENRGNGKTTGLNVYHFMHKLYEKRNKLKKALEQVKQEIGSGSDAYVLLKEQFDDVEIQCKEKEMTVYYLEPIQPTTNSTTCRVL